MLLADLRAASRRRWTALVDRFAALELSESAILIGFSVAIGAVAALGVVGFYRAIDLAYLVFYRVPGRWLGFVALAGWRPIVTAVGMVVAWWTMRALGRGHDGLNVPDVQQAVVRQGGRLPARPALARTLASAITIGGGGSAGSEGPVVVLGAAVGSMVGQGFRFTPDRVRVLVGAGAGAAISAAFNAPIAGAFFALEEIIGSVGGSLSTGAFPPIVVASVVAAVVSRAFLGNHPAFPIPVEYGYGTLREVLVYFPLLGVLLGIVAATFVRTYFGVEALASRFRRFGALLPLAGGLVVGAMVVASRGLLVGYGHLAVHLEVFGRMPWWALALLALGSIVATSITLNTGGSGGLFTPSLYVGAAAGGAVGVLLAKLDPAGATRPETYAIVGMGALVAAATHAPITGILLVFEMTNDYAMVLPLMLTTVVAYLVAHRLDPDSLYSGWLHRRGIRLEGGADRDILAGIRVAEAFDREAFVIRDDETVPQLMEHLGRGDQTIFPVADVEGALVGVITIADLGRIARDHRELSPIVVAADVATPVESVAPDESLLAAIRRMGVRGAAAIPVVDPATGDLLGMLSRAHVLAVYERAVAGAHAAGGAHAETEGVQLA